MLIQGTIDTLFPVEEGIRNYLNLRAAHTPVKLLTYCSGHTVAGCTYPGGASGYPEGAGDRAPIYQDRIVAWLDRYVKGEHVETGPRIEWQAQDGRYYPGSRYPLAGTRTTPGTTVETGTIFGPGPGGGDGPADGNPAPEQELGRSAARATILEAADQPRSIFGIPTAHLTGSVTGYQGFAFLELVDVAPDGTLDTLDDQVMPIALSGGAVDRTIELHGVSWRLEQGHSLQLEVTSGSEQYAIPRTGPYALDLSVDVDLPVAKA
jgi:ABC-2 type transport system ATP-binding protein